MKKELELYVHIPFCVKKCAYCDFLSFSAKQEEVSAYVEALAEEIKGKKEQFSDYCVTTIFLGGGTPSILEGVYTASIFRALRESFDIAENAEITMEVNPGTVSEEKINMWKTCGVNRLSIGLQSVDDGELKMLGRIHTYDEFLTTWKMVRKAGFHNVNIDLISAIPGQTKKSWETTLRTVAQLQPEHISAYSLIIEEGTVFGTIYGEDGERICQKELLSRESSMPEVSDKDGNIRKDRQILPLPDVKNITIDGKSTEEGREASARACERACEIIEEMGAQNFCEFIVTGNATKISSSSPVTIWQRSLAAAGAVGSNAGWMSFRNPADYISYGYPWANLSTENLYFEGKTVNKNGYSVQKFLDAGLKLSVYNADLDVDMDYYLAYKDKLYAICTNYPRKLLGKWN